jgi:hypothetical protein
MTTIILSNLPMDMDKAIPCIKAMRFAFGLGLRDAKFMFDYMKSIGKNSIEYPQNPNRDFEEIYTYIHSNERSEQMGYCDLPYVIVAQNESENWDFTIGELFMELLRKDMELYRNNSMVISMQQELKELKEIHSHKTEKRTVTIVIDGKTIFIGNADSVHIE